MPVFGLLQSPTQKWASFGIAPLALGAYGTRMGRRTVPTLIVLNILVYLTWNFGSPRELQFMVDHFLVSWSALSDGRLWVLLTSVFSHNMFFHLFMNMYVLNSFGPIIEAILGTRRFLTFYIVAGIFSSLCHATVSAFLLAKPDMPALGASGAISGIILFFSLLFPREKILLFGFIPMPAFFGALAFIGLDIAGLVAQAEGGGLPIGHGAHLGGAFAGIVFYFLHRRRLIQQLPG